MNLHVIAESYMTEIFTDPLNPSATAIRGVVRPFAEVTNSGPSSRRRILELRPDVVIFPSYLVKKGAQVYVVGGKNIDYWHDEQIRQKYPILPCDLILYACTTEQILTNVLPTAPLYGYPHFVRGSVADTQTSSVTPNFSIYCSNAATGLGKGTIFKDGTKYYKARSMPYLDGAMFQVLEAIELDTPLKSLTYVRQTGYDPITDTITAGSSTVVPAFVEDAFFAYDHTSERQAHLEPGDKTITVKPPQAPRAGELIGDYRILTIDLDAQGCSVCHCRK